MGHELARTWKTAVQILSVLKASDRAAELDYSNSLPELQNRRLDVHERWPGGKVTLSEQGTDLCRSTLLT